MKIKISESQYNRLISEQETAFTRQLDKTFSTSQSAEKYLNEMDPHSLLMITQIATAFIPVVGPFVSAGIGLADAAIYLSENDKKSAGMSAIFALLPGVLNVVSKIPGIKKLGENGMKLLADKIIKNGNKAKLTPDEINVVNGLSKEQKLVTQELNQYSKNIANKAVSTTANAGTKQILKKIGKFGLNLSGQLAIYGGAAATYDKVYDYVNPLDKQNDLSNIDLSTVTPSKKSFEVAKQIQW